MTTAYNLQRKFDQMREVGAASLRDPGSGGTVQISPHFGMGTLLIETTGGRTLQAAAQVPLGTRVLVFATAASITVDGTAIADGEYLEFVRGTDASAVPEWEVFDPSTSEQDITTLQAEVVALQTLPVNAQTGTTYTLLAADNGKVVTLSNASAILLTIPDLGAGFNCTIVQIGAGLVTVVGDSVTVNTRSASLTMHGQYSAAEVKFYAAGICSVTGDVSPLLEVNAQTGTSYSVVLSDNGGLITSANASAVAIDFPDSLPVGFHVKIVQIGAGLVTVGAAGSAAIVTESAALTTNAQEGAGEMVCYAANLYNWHTFDISGS